MDKENIKNPREYFYPQGTKVEIEGHVITDMIMLLEQLVDSEIKKESKFKYNFVNEKGAIVKDAKESDIESGKVKKVLDFDRTIMNPKMEYSITEKGLAYAELVRFFESIHFQNVKDGKAVHHTEINKNIKEN